MLASASGWLQQHLLHVHGPLVYLIVAALVFFEVAIVIGFFVPGEIASIIGGVIASQHHANVVLMVAVVVAAAIVGNFCGYGLGKVFGPWLLSHRPLEGKRSVDRAQRLVATRGGPAVFVGRWIAVVRALVPGLAGMSDMEIGTFSLFTILGGLGWGTMWVLIGFAAGLSYTKVVAAAGKWSLLVVGVLFAAVVAYVVWREVRTRRSRHR